MYLRCGEIRRFAASGEKFYIRAPLRIPHTTNRRNFKRCPIKNPHLGEFSLRCGLLYEKRPDTKVPNRQKATVSDMKTATNGYVLCVKLRYSSKTLLAGRQFRMIQGKTVINQISYVYKGIKETKITQKYEGQRVVREYRSIFDSSLRVKPK